MLLKKNLLIALGLFMLLGSSLAAHSLVGNSLRADDKRELQLVGQNALEDRPEVTYADIWVHGQYAYLGTFNPGNGVKVVDVSNPANPQLVRTLIGSRSASYEDVMVITVNTPAFQGDLLAVGLQGTPKSAKSKDKVNGVQFWDVTDPLNAKLLSFFDTGFPKRGSGRTGVHELSLVQRDNRVFALLAVPFSEQRELGGDFRLVEVTDPRNPKQLSDWGLKNLAQAQDAHAHNRIDPQHDEEEEGADGLKFCHSVWTDEEGKIAYLSFWDEGSIMIDISDPARPKFIGKTSYTREEEGNAHSSWRVKGTNILLVDDEDFTVGKVDLKVTAPQPAPVGNFIFQLGSGKQVCETGPINGEAVFIGRGCKKKEYSSRDLNGKIVIVENATENCGLTPAAKVLAAQKAGAAAVLIGVESSFGFNAPSAPITIPILVLPLRDLKGVIDTLASGQTVTMNIAPSPTDTWGFVRFYDISNPASPKQVSRFGTPNSLSCATPPPGSALFGYTVHNPFVVDNLAYFSWYADGIRVVDISDPLNPREVASFVPPQASMWGVYVQNGLIYGSDIRKGLFILKNIDK